MTITPEILERIIEGGQQAGVSANHCDAHGVHGPAGRLRQCAEDLLVVIEALKKAEAERDEAESELRSHKAAIEGMQAELLKVKESSGLSLADCKRAEAISDAVQTELEALKITNAKRTVMLSEYVSPPCCDCQEFPDGTNDCDYCNLSRWCSDDDVAAARELLEKDDT